MTSRQNPDIKISSDHLDFKEILKPRSLMLIGCLLLFFVLQCVFSMRLKSATSDEFSHHLASGYSHLVKRDFRMNPAMPPLPRMMSAIPMWILGAKGPWEHDSWKTGDSPEFARQFFYESNPNGHELIFWSRTPTIILSILFALSIFLWCYYLFGRVGAFIALGIYCFEPNIIAHSRLATSDLSVAFFYFLTIVAFWAYLKKPTIKRMVLTGIACGACFLSKFTALLLLPTLLLVACFSKQFRSIKLIKAIIFLMITAFTIWAGYFFELKPLIEGVPDIPKKEAFLNSIGGPALVTFAKTVPIPLASFSQALGSMMFTRVAGTKAFLWGEWSRQGWWYYYFAALGIKNTLPMLLLGFAGFIALFRSKLDSISKYSLAIPIILLFIVTMPDKAQAGIRYFLPIYPLWIILAGAFAAWVCTKGKIAQLIIATMLCWHVYAALNVYPDYLTYFNETVGGPTRGHLYLRDSNIDWGQDLMQLAQWVKQNEYKEIVVSYYGGAVPAKEGIPVRDFSEEEYLMPQNRVYAIGAHHIDSVQWYDQYEPVKIIGNTIYVYDFRQSMHKREAISK